MLHQYKKFQHKNNTHEIFLHENLLIYSELKRAESTKRFQYPELCKSSHKN